MTDDEAIAKFGLPADTKHRQKICQWVCEELAKPDEADIDVDLVRSLCVQLFSIGNVKDSLLIWQAKRRSFDLGMGLDIQLLCGAGFKETIVFLQSHSSNEAMKAIDELGECQKAEDFDDFSVANWIDHYREYYGLD